LRGATDGAVVDVVANGRAGLLDAVIVGDVTLASLARPAFISGTTDERDRIREFADFGSGSPKDSDDSFISKG
jgi:hypothetical protein